MNLENQYTDHLETPLGTMEITASELAVHAIHFVDLNAAVKRNELTDITKQQLQEYFAGDREMFDLPLDPIGTMFQQKVWRALTTISFGQTCSYSDIATKIDNPKGVRAVGAANGKNPLTIVVPCHRVIGSNGALTGYASGVERKAWLLDHERKGLF